MTLILVGTVALRRPRAQRGLVATSACPEGWTEGDDDSLPEDIDEENSRRS